MRSAVLVSLQAQHLHPFSSPRALLLRSWAGFRPQRRHLSPRNSPLLALPVVGFLAPQPSPARLIAGAPLRARYRQPSLRKHQLTWVARRVSPQHHGPRRALISIVYWISRHLRPRLRLLSRSHHLRSLRSTRFSTSRERRQPVKVRPIRQTGRRIQNPPLTPTGA